jgi:NAD(P)-dependent dehydrogenase (short-subunit alcohol dehydrogenase family)
VSDSLRGREVVLAGGAGGLGAATAALLAAEGVRLVISYRANSARAERCRERGTVVQADLGLAPERQRLLDAAPGIYGLVVFAGIPARVSDPAKLQDVMAQSWQVNFAGPLMLAREAAERMKAAGTPGAIVLLSTMQAVALFPGSAAYASPKAALAHAARILAKEYRGGANVRVNVVAPGVMAAGMAEASIASGKYDRFIQEGAIGRFGRAGDVARAVRFFLEPDNYITGQILSVDGGITL